MHHQRNLRAAITALIIFIMGGALAAPAEAQGIFARTANGGALVWFKREQKGRVAYWSGRRDAQGYATGEGVFEVVTKGKLFCVYAGVMHGGRMSGQVVAQFPQTGLRYEGEVEDHNENGTGRMVYPNGAIYAGEWYDAQWEGRGMFRFPDGQTVVGQFRNGQLVSTEYRGYPEREQSARSASPVRYSERSTLSTEVSGNEDQQLYQLAARLVLTVGCEVVKRGLLETAQNQDEEFGTRLVAAVGVLGARAARDACIESTVQSAFPGASGSLQTAICKICSMALDGKFNAQGVTEEMRDQFIENQLSTASADTQTTWKVVKFVTAIGQNMTN